jgi:hypothetical protein
MAQRLLHGSEWHQQASVARVESTRVRQRREAWAWALHTLMLWMTAWFAKGRRVGVNKGKSKVGGVNKHKHGHIRFAHLPPTAAHRRLQNAKDKADTEAARNLVAQMNRILLDKDVQASIAMVAREPIQTMRPRAHSI